MRRTNRPFDDDDRYFNNYENNFFENRIMPALIFGGIIAVIANIVYGIKYLKHLNL